MLGSDGRAYHWVVQCPLVPHATRRDERMAQLHIVVNDVLAHAVQARRRHVSVAGQTVVSITHRMRLVEDDPSHCSLQEVYDAHCLASGTDSDAPLMLCRERLSALPKLDRSKPTAAAGTAEAAQQQAAQQQQQADQDARKLRIYNEVRHHHHHHHQY